jgi:hypothetical protein
MISTATAGRVVPDIYATVNEGSGDADTDHATEIYKLQDHHAKLIHNDIHQRYGQETEPSEPW